MSRRLVTGILVVIMAVLIVAIAVLAVFHWLFAALGDESAARTLFGFAVGCLVMLTIDVLLLVGLTSWLVGFADRRDEIPSDFDQR